MRGCNQDGVGLTAIVHLTISPDAILSSTTLTALREKALAGR